MNKVYQLVYRLAMHAFLGVLSVWSGRGKLARRVAGLRAQREELVESNEEPCYWMHCASVGEYEQIRPLIDRILLDTSDARVVVSFFSSSGMEWSRKEEVPYACYYLPWDLPGRMRPFIKAIRPHTLILVKYELWSTMLAEAKRYGCRMYLVSARFYRGHTMLGQARFYYLPLLKMLDHIYVQNHESQAILSQYDVPCVVSGDTRADRVLEQAKKSDERFAPFFAGGRDRPLLVVGSAWPEDWACFSPWIDELLEHYDLLVAPHEMHDGFLDEITRDIPGILRFSSTERKTWSESQAMLMDAVGYLFDCYRYADVAYVGGGFRTGLHNVFEPAAHGCPVVFGPNTSAFREADDLEHFGAGWRIESDQDLKEHLLRLLDEKFRQSASRSALEYVKSSAGSTDLIYEEVRWEGLVNH